MKIKGTITMLFILFILSPCSVEKHFNEWIKEGNEYYYYNNSGEKLRNTSIELSGSTYYFDTKGVMLTGWNSFGVDKRYFDDNGVMSIGWKQIDENWYLFDNQGIMQKEWATDGNNWYYFNDNGIMQKSKWIKNEYFVDENGKMLSNGWYKIDGVEYYLDANGKVDRTKNYNEELKKLKQQEQQNKYNQRKRTLIYEDFSGSHTINFILPELPAKTKMGLTISGLDIRYSVNQDWGGGVNIWMICSGTKDTYTYPQVQILGEGNMSRVFVAQPSSDYNYLRSTFRVSTDIEEIFTMEKELTFELSFLN